MQALVQQGMEGMIYSSRDIFLLNQFPCKMVEIVAWVAGVDHKESAMTVTLDDGDGIHVLPVLIRLSLMKPPKSTSVKPSKSLSVSTSFLTPGERREAKRKAAEESIESVRVSKWSDTKVYERKDVRVGDTVRVIGKVDEWIRRKSDGSSEWVRQVVVDENAGGSMIVVDPDDQFIHTAQVHKLHHILYSRPFLIPDLSNSNRFNISSPYKDSSMIDPSFSVGFETTLTSEAPSELSMIDAEPELRDPTKLRSSQLTDRTFRQYMLDHMTQETVRALIQASEIGSTKLRQELENFFPEYRNTNKSAGKRKSVLKSSYGSDTVGIFTPSTRMNTLPAESPVTPTQKSFISRKSTRLTSSMTSTPNILQAFTPISLLSNDRLYTLARLVVDNEARKEDRRRRRRIRDGTATKKDFVLESERKVLLTNGEVEASTIDDKERRRRMERLVSWAIRAISEEGSLVQVTLPLSQVSASITSSDRYGYLPLPPQLLFPLCVPHMVAEKELRSRTIRRKNDPKTSNGVTVDELTIIFKRWGEDGRWERIGDWNIEDALEWAQSKGHLRKQGVGWWVVDDHDG
ncbi:uncharacterized protein IL334_003783 [Kwoniella shivajii]|uniref:Uncharacterized protein n=1 Tax=Kwoniella shivajii TaxID=564305 RepID=A0ABZ1CYI0_9TREE|nr:hypothetical protein IL334_003783 [Kwoniella shivajii]